MYQPLADALRPQSLDDVCGQSHILGENGLLRRIIDSGKIPNMIFYGPSGTGKTTVANIIAQRTHRKLCKLNATTASSGDIKEIYAQLDTFLAPNGVLLYLDEIQYFNKSSSRRCSSTLKTARSRSSRPRRKIRISTCTTQFCRGRRFLNSSPYRQTRQKKAIARAVRALEQQNGVKAKIEDGVVSYVAQACGGDIRKAMNAVELLFSASGRKDGEVALTLADAKQITQRSAMRYDRAGDEHYDDLSALMKSIRGSDPRRGNSLSGAVSGGRRFAQRVPADSLLRVRGHWTCLSRRRLRLSRHALTVRCSWGFRRRGFPLADAVILLATAPKSNSGCIAIDRAIHDVKTGKTGNIPRQLQNVHADGTGFEREQGYLYPHNYPHAWVRQQYLPDEIKDRRYYEYGDNKTEQAAKRYWDEIKK